MKVVNLDKPPDMRAGVPKSPTVCTLMLCRVDALVLSPWCGLVIEAMTAEKECHVKRTLNSTPGNQDWSAVPVV